MPRNEKDAPATVGAAYHQSLEGAMTSAVGRHGLSDRVLSQYLTRARDPLAILKDNYKTGRLELLTIPEETADIDAAEAALAKLSKNAKLIVFFGTGGSGLGGQTLAQLAGWNIPGGGDAYQRKRPRTRFLDNLDGSTLTGALTDLDFARTRFIVTSKSGGTTETLAQAIAAIQAVREAGLGDKIPDLFLGITEPAKKGKQNGLRELFESLSIPMLEHSTGIGGRFSCLTNVGLMPAMARGLDARAIRAGAREVVEAMLAAKSPKDFAPAVGAAAAVALAKEKGVHNLVMMPYSDRLGRMSEWFVQLWAESLGKNGEGTSPIACTGPLDQHSQLQLFMDGPREHYITVVRTPTEGTGPKLDAALAKKAGAGYMASRHVGDVVAAQAQAITEALREAGRPVRTFDLAALDERSIGALLMHLMIETILAGRILGIDPFDQPAVELAKVLTRQRLGAKG
ncbi:MAG: glucose-6-phosphate isomerase [Hyphomicrobiaceae bacterium]|nr:glucose-6-phosphate isomerase [Hyphomicrobiaceae bacterium]